MPHLARDLPRGVREFLAEAEEALEDLSRNLAILADAARSGDDHPDLVNAIFRDAHSLKGLAGMLGYTDLSGLAHHMETLLDLIRLGKVPLADQTLEVLFAALDALAGLVRSCGRDESLPDITGVLERIDSCCVRPVAPISSNPPQPLLPERITGALTEFEEHRLEETVRRGRQIYLVHASFLLESFDRELESLIGLLKSRGEVISTLPSPGRERLDSIDFDLLVGAQGPLIPLPSGVSCEEIAVDPGTMSHHDKVYGREEPVQGVSSPPLDQTVSARSISGTVRVDIGRLDELMAIVGELIATQATLAEAVGNVSVISPVGTDGLVKIAGCLGKKLNELQEGVMEIRLVPVRVLYDKLARIVRKIAADEGRNVDLVLHGAETKLDKQIIEDISDPLMHLVRNAIDHGIELPAERIEAGKPETGQITVSARQKGNRVLIEVADDGRGIDLGKVRRRAGERGLVSHPGDLTDQEAIDLIFEPGFSTSEVVSELSGRGVGMDVVKNNITALSGTVAVETRPGHGSRVSLALPITLAIIRTLIIDDGDETYGVPVVAVQETVPVAPGDILTLEGNEVLPVRELLYPVVCLDRFFGGMAVPPRERAGFAVVAGAASRRVGIMVDGIRGQQDLVLKSLGELLGEVRGIAGAADLGEGKTILVLDVAGIIDELYRGGGLVP
jgi:two-component system chemotaxis sensor kinase CheA